MTAYHKVCEAFAVRLREAIERASGLREPFSVAEEARGFWIAEYDRLEAERSGNYGKATARLSVHALKIAMLYAALDGENAIGVRHLGAALSLIAHADRTACDLFGSASVVAFGEEPPHAKLLVYARTQKDGITKTDAHRLFSNKRKGHEIEADFALLTNSGFGRWEGDRWFVKEHLPESDKGVVVVQQDLATCKPTPCQTTDDIINDFMQRMNAI